jgi:DNA-binding transcriptional LysR family regulator
MDLKRLNHFMTLAEERRFAAAAQRVHLSTAAFSRSIQSLEDSVGMRLFDRLPQGTVLTRAGEVLRRRAAALLAESRSLAHEIDLLKSGGAGELGIGAAPVPAVTLLPSLLAKLRPDGAKRVTKVRVGNLGQLLDRLELEEIDFCLGDPRLLVDAERYEMVPVGLQSSSLYCRPGHDLRARGVANVAALRHYGLALSALNAPLRARFSEDMGFDSPADFPQVLECDDFGMLARIVADSDLLGVLPSRCWHADATHLQPLQFEGGTLPLVRVHALWLQGHSLSPVAQRAVALAQEIGATLSEQR